MKKQIVHVEPIFKERIWGGTMMRTRFHGETDIDRIGEMWCVAALKGNGDNRLREIDMTLSEAYEKLPDWFVCDSERFPLRCTLMDPIDNLSVQVHPTEEYAKKNYDSYGKPEAWYVLETNGNNKIQFGHTAQTKEEFLAKADASQWDGLLSYVDANAGDFLNVPAGTIHAIGKNVVTFEISRNADITYRIFDYNRVDAKTNQHRDLHLDRAMEVLTIPHQEKGPIHPEPFLFKGCLISVFIDEPKQFTLKKIETETQGIFEDPRFYFLSVIEGEGKVDQIDVRQGTTLLVPDSFGEINITGKLTILVSSYRDH